MSVADNMKEDLFKKFVSLDDDVFTQIMDQLGYEMAACYRLKADHASYLIGSDAKKWPASEKVDQLYYNVKKFPGLPLGWVIPKFSTELRKIWPKKVFLYFPEQELSAVKLVFFVQLRSRRTFIDGQLDGPLEAMATRIRAWVDRADTCHFITEAIVEEQALRHGADTQTLVDHELRTPLSVILGYGHMIADLSEKLPEAAEISNAIRHNAEIAMSAVEKLSFSTRSVFHAVLQDHEIGEVDVPAVVRRVCEDVEQAGVLADDSLNISVAVADDAEISVSGVESLIHKAVLEVIKNAVNHTARGDIKVSIYATAGTAVVEVIDDGRGVPIGNEELIFLRFFRWNNSAKGNRFNQGLGLGLYIARYIAEQHHGQLYYVRNSKHRGMFRFLLPLKEASVEKTELAS